VEWSTERFGMASRSLRGYHSYERSACYRFTYQNQIGSGKWNSDNGPLRPTVKKLGRLLWQQAAPFNSSIACYCSSPPSSPLSSSPWLLSSCAISGLGHERDRRSDLEEFLRYRFDYGLMSISFFNMVISFQFKAIA